MTLISALLMLLTLVLTLLASCLVFVVVRVLRASAGSDDDAYLRTLERSRSVSAQSVVI